MNDNWAEKYCVPLKGSEKQIAWANAIRAKAIRGISGESIPHALEKLTDASWWIQNREDAGTALCGVACRISSDYALRHGW